MNNVVAGWQFVASQAEGLPQPSLDFVTVNRSPIMLLGNGHAQAGRTGISRHYTQLKTPVSDAPAVPENAAEFRRPP